MGLEVTKVDHVGIAVRDIGEALGLFGDVMGAEFLSGGDNDRGFRTMQLLLGDSKLELIQPIGEDSYLRGHLDRRGPGFHHMTIFVADLLEAVRVLEERGYEVVDVNTSSPTWSEAYVRPRSAFGALLQIVQTDREWATEGFEGVTLERVLAGEIQWNSPLPAPRER